MTNKRQGHNCSSNPSSKRLYDLRHLIKSMKLSKLPVDDIVDRLRPKFPDVYNEQEKLGEFTGRVQHALQLQRAFDFQMGRKKFTVSSGNDIEFDNDDDWVDNDDDNSSRRKQKKKRRKTMMKVKDSSSGSEMTYEDAVYDQKVEPVMDLMKHTLRANQAGVNSGLKVENSEIKNMEIEVETKSNKKTRIMGLSKGETNTKKSNLSGDLKGVVGDIESTNYDHQGPKFKDLGGIKGILDELINDILFPLYHPELLRYLGVKPLSGILLHGPPGCGKTQLAHAIANEARIPFYKISATEVVNGVSGASEENIRNLFKKARETSPSIVFIDEIDSIASKRENLQREMEKRIVTQLLTCMDKSYEVRGTTDADSGSTTSGKKTGYVLVIGATNRPDAIDPALRRPGRFDREIALGVPDENARSEILSVLCRNLRLEMGCNFDLAKIAKATPGFVGADLSALVDKAGNLAMKRIVDSWKLNNEATDGDWYRQPWEAKDMEGLSISMGDFEDAVKMIQPSSRREGFSTIPNVKWEDVGGLDLLRKEFDRYIISRIKHPGDFEEFGIDLEQGFLLYGPPGCGKTLIAKALAHEAGANFIHIKGPELLNKYVGEGESAVRTIFNRARTCSPCILFFDEVDALTTKRGNDGGWVVERLLTQLLIELDGADKRRGVFVVGATNRERGLILKAIARNKPISEDVDLVAIGQEEAYENLSGADLAAVVNEAAMIALDEKRMSDEGSSEVKKWINKTHFDRAVAEIAPSVSDKRRRYYEKLSGV
ncbi:hypothetical protein MKW94_013349 [Papaver nudicaule]|uniref:AAA+ ATPase domain-containing protein n=1 Tax=Papaver nudicaule TaxID=74823 RepID=A0AA41W2H3_PAPNU|nr:hypothetical protein [Papaver nudicaule]